MIGLLLCTAAWGGELEGQVALDTLHASTSSTEPGSGPSEGLSATELGMRLRGELLELDDRLEVGVDYRGREPLPSEFSNSSRRLLYRLDAAYELVEDRVTVGLGRFTAPSALFLIVDGGRVEVALDEQTTLLAYGGRRGISTGLITLPADVMLPAAGLALLRRTERYGAEVVGGIAGDQVQLGTDTSPATDEVLSASALGRLWWRVSETTDVGGQGSAAQQATYVLGSVADDPEITVEALDLYRASVWTAWRPVEVVRVQGDAIHQEATVNRAAFEDLELVDPSFTDLRLRPMVRPLDVGWLRADGRLRLRPDRTELRYGGGLDLDNVGVDGLFARGLLQIDDILRDDSAANDVGAVDRLLWRASAGYSKGGLDLEAGASFIDRAAGPVSGRAASPTDPSVPGSSSDLNPFVLEAQNVVFARGFLSTRQWFVGTDLEVNVEDVPEIRAYVQLGALTEARW